MPSDRTHERKDHGALFRLLASTLDHWNINQHSDDRGPNIARYSFRINTHAREPIRRRCNSEAGFS
ncbi:hypothetical protein E8E15_000275 [Penicillium rubens]|nr:hypothetical protein E8E15_000275 [Penicillium rubens]